MFWYGAALLTSLVGLGLLDYRHKLAIFAGFPLRTFLTIGTGILFFLAWDIVGISQGVFFRGAGPYQTGLLLGPELPLEEVLFLALLCYVTLLSYVAGVRWRASRRATP